jgi:hypothetical protein
MNELTHHLNHGINSTLEIITSIIIGLIISTIFSIIILKGTKNRLRNSIILNAFFYISIFILHQISIEKNINISVFSSERKEEPWLIISFIITFIIITFLQVIIFRKWLKKNLKYQLLTSNFIFLTIVLLVFYPKNYTNKNIINYDRILFLPDKTEFKLLDNIIIKIDTACTSKDNYINGKVNSSYSFRIPIISPKNERMKFGFQLLNTSNQFGASENGSNCKVLPIKNLKDKIIVLIKQKNPKKNIGWKKPIITDTITYRKIKVEKRKAGYYGDTDCDCIEH